MKSISGIVIIALLLTVSAERGVAQSGYDLFQQALVKERAHGQIQEAIQLYQRIVNEYARDRALAAKALVQMGRAYETLGSREAQKAYERVLRDYADQREVAAEARMRLSALRQALATAATTTKTAREVWTGRGVGFEGSISPDGRYLSFADWESGNLGVHDFATGENRNITSGGTFASDSTYNYAEVSKWSPDGKQLAYTRWFKNTYELRLTGFEGLDSRLLYRHPDVYYPYPGGWSPDGRYLSLSLVHWDGAHQIALMSIADGSVRVLKSLGRVGEVAHVDRFSPDGVYFAYTAPPDETSRNRDIFLMAADGSREVRLTDTRAADEDILGWTPDGALLFNSNRTGRYALWMIRVEDGRAVGSPILLKPDLGNVERLGTTRDGALYYGVAQRDWDAFTVAFDPTTAEVIGSPEPINASFLGATRALAWSADGKHVAYSSERGQEHVLVIRSLQSGREKLITREMRLGGPKKLSLQWHPDGASLFVEGQYRNRRGVFQLDIGTEGARPEFVHDGPLGVVSPDGKTEYSVQQEFSEDRENVVRAAIVMSDLTTGQVSELYRWVPGDVPPTIALSSDGREIAFRAGTPDAPVLNILSTAGGEPRHLTDLFYRGEPISWLRGLVWAPDGRHILFNGRCCEVEQLYRVSTSGGGPEPAGLATTKQNPHYFFNKSQLGFRPDGRQLGFVARRRLAPPGVWVLENFLPTSDGSR